ncbi:hypothetical protein CPB83DRAFT_897306 [Crepidotus variabilis]|uniref:Uncharacterized protein n=1 Tax=Crepidotus variabilis TaxID=179855 RepID=A0A9P6E9Z7_9AGAR|nr:hypothetical protein CPB83DRAFT_897306 [Crepidotus variabilis]
MNDFDLRGSNAYLHSYHSALSTASSITKKLGWQQETYSYLFKSAISSGYLANIYPETTLEVYFAWSLYSLAGLDQNIMSVDQALGYLEEAIGIIKRVYNYNPHLYAFEKLDFIVRKAEIQVGSGRLDEAYQTLLEVLQLDLYVAETKKVTQALKRASSCFRNIGLREEAITLQLRAIEIRRAADGGPSVDEVDIYINLANDYELQGQICHAISAAENALEQVQVLAQSSFDHNRFLATSLSCWINLTSSTSVDHKPIFDRVTRVFDQYTTIVDEKTSFMNNYHELMTSVVRELTHPSAAIIFSLDVVERLRKLARDHPEDVGIHLPNWLSEHGRRLAKFGHLVEAEVWLERVGDDYHDLASTDAEIGQWYICLQIHLACVIRDRGNPKKARNVLKNVAQIGKQLPDIDSNIAFYTTVAISYEAELAGCLGRQSEALKIGTDCVLLAQSYCLLEEEDIAVSQLQHSRLLTVNNHYKEALLEAQEATKTMLDRTNNEPTRYDLCQFFWPSEFLRTWASSLADVDEITEASRIAHQGLEEARRVNDATSVGVLGKTSEGFYASAVWTLGCIELFSSHRDRALSLLEEAREIWKRRSDVRRFELRNWALTLWSLRFTYCQLGRHDEGVLAGRELKKLINGLRYAEPMMHSIISVALDQERRRPAWVHFLDRVAQGQQCEHLVEFMPKANLN